MKYFTLFLTAVLVVPSSAAANDWQKFYISAHNNLLIEPNPTPPEIMRSSGNVDQDIESMWKEGFGLLGVSSFNSPNDKTTDAVRWGTQLKARYVVLNTNLSSSTSSTIPLTMPNNTTSTTNGTVSNGYSTGSFNATTTNYGTQTTYIPITINRFDKVAIFFGIVSHQGAGVLLRTLTPPEVARYETQRGFVVKSVRNDSPAYTANVLPGDVILTVNDQPADSTSWRSALTSNGPLKVHLVRNGQPRNVSIVVNEDWRPKP